MGRNQKLWAKILRPFSKVHPEETGLLALMTLTAFLLLTAYYLLKTVREPLILLQGGAEMKLYARAGQALAMAVFVHFYAELARRVGRARLLTIVFLFFISNLAAFTILARLNVPIGLPFFVWVGVFSYTVVAQFWALAADIYDREQGKRLFPLIGAGSSIGAVVGGIVARAIVPLGVPALMGTAVLLLLVCAALIASIQSRARTAAPRQTAEVEVPVLADAAWRRLSRDRYLWLIAGMVILLNWVNSSGEYLLDRTLLTAARASASFAPQTFIGAFKADYYVWYNAIGLALQLLVVSRVLTVLGVRFALYCLPAFAVFGYGAAFMVPTLAVIRMVKIGENSLQYSLQETTRHALFLVTSRDEKFVGKTAIDTVAVRVGAIMSALFVYAGSRLKWSTSTFAAINLVLAAAWIAFVIGIGREHRRRELSAARDDASGQPMPPSRALQPF